MRRFAPHCLLAAACLAAAASAPAEPLLPVSNQGALARGFALPELGAAELAPAGGNQWRLALDWTNEFFDQQTDRERLVLDGETQRWALDWRRGLGRDFELNAELPLLVTGGGVMDGLIHNWHDIWGLPDGGRADAPHDRYLYQYQRNGATVLNVDTATAGPGDIQLGAAWQAVPALALRAMLKLPSGDAGRLTGGNTGAALWADYDPFAGSRRWLGFVSGGASVNDAGQVLPAQQHRLVGFAGAGVGYRLWPQLAVTGQLYGHSQLYADSDLKALRRDALQLALGLRWQLRPALRLSGGFQEDLVTDSSPDFSIHLDLGWH